MDRKELLKEWVDILRSGEYKQGLAFLKSEDKFCCLGVLTDICINKDLIDDDWQDGYVEGEFEILPPSVRALTGLSYEGRIRNRSLPVAKKLLKKYKGNEEFRDLSGFNDSGATFEEIVDLIEEQFIND